MFLLLFVQLNKQKNNSTQTLHSMLLCCCLLQGQDGVPRLCSACLSVQGDEKAPVCPELGPAVAAGLLWVPRQPRAACASAAQAPGAAAEPGAGRAVLGAGEWPVLPEPSRTEISGVLRTHSGGSSCATGSCALPTSPPLLCREPRTAAARGTAGKAQQAPAEPRARAG